MGCIVADPRVLELVTEIRDLYQRQCALADQMRVQIDAQAERVKVSSRARAAPGYPELERFDSIYDAHEMYRKAREHPPIRFRAGVLYVLTVAAILVTCTGIVLRTGSATLSLAGTLSMAVFMWWVQYRCLQPRIQRWLREELVRRKVPICVICGYDLRGQTTSRCPECGTSSPLAGAGPFRRSYEVSQPRPYG